MPNRITFRSNYTGEQEGSVQREPEAQFKTYEVDPAGLINVLLRRRRLIAGVVGAVGILAAVMMLLTPNRYTSRATILPSGGPEAFSALGSVAGLATAFGIEEANSSALYPTILRSSLVRDSVLAHAYTYHDYDTLVTRTLAKYIGGGNQERLRRALSGITTITDDTRTGELTIAVEMRVPELSQGVVNEYLRQLENFNLHSRRSEAGERVRYLAREIDTRRIALAESEDSLGAFQGRNRNWSTTTDPFVLKQAGRLKRDVDIKAQTLTYLMQEYEAARLDAQKDVPVVRVLDYGSLPTLKSGPRRTATVLTAAFVAFLIVSLSVIGIDMARQVLSASPQNSRREFTTQLDRAFPWARRLYHRIERGKRAAISVDS